MSTSQPTFHPLDDTHDAGLQSWVESANDPNTDFPIQNLPFGRFCTGRGDWRLGVAIGDSILDLRAAGLVDHDDMNRLFNDWSARDIQAWEYQPLGPFLSKNFASTIAPWVVTLDALAPFRVPFLRPQDDPEPLPYLDSPQNRAQGAIDLELEVWLQTATMRAAGHPGDRLTRANYRDAYWTMAQMVAHHTVNGCNLRSGDLFGSGTLSGPADEEAGSLLELSAGGKRPLNLASGETRTFLEDGDTVILRGYCQRDGVTRIGLGECRGTVLPARQVS